MLYIGIRGMGGHGMCSFLWKLWCLGGHRVRTPRGRSPTKYFGEGSISLEGCSLSVGTRTVISPLLRTQIRHSRGDSRGYVSSVRISDTFRFNVSRSS